MRPSVPRRHRFRSRRNARCGPAAGRGARGQRSRRSRRRSTGRACSSRSRAAPSPGRRERQGTDRQHERARHEGEHTCRRDSRLAAHRIDQRTRGQLADQRGHRADAQREADGGQRPALGGEVDRDEGPETGLDVGDEEVEPGERAFSRVCGPRPSAHVRGCARLPGRVHAGLLPVARASPWSAGVSSGGGVATSTGFGTFSLNSRAPWICSRVIFRTRSAGRRTAGVEDELSPVDRDLPAADAEKAAEVDDQRPRPPRPSTSTFTTRPSSSSAVPDVLRPRMGTTSSAAMVSCRLGRPLPVPAGAAPVPSRASAPAVVALGLRRCGFALRRAAGMTSAKRHRGKSGSAPRPAGKQEAPCREGPRAGVGHVARAECDARAGGRYIAAVDSLARQQLRSACRPR